MIGYRTDSVAGYFAYSKLVLERKMHTVLFSTHTLFFVLTTLNCCTFAFFSRIQVLASVCCDLAAYLAGHPALSIAGHPAFHIRIIRADIRYIPL